MTFQVGCKLSLVFFQYCIMANFYWLLVEGLYLHTLLVAIFSPSRRFPAYLLIGWGKDASPCCPPCARALHTPSATPDTAQLACVRSRDTLHRSADRRCQGEALGRCAGG